MTKTKKHIISESTKWECKIKKEKENGETVYSIYEINGNVWVATFPDKKSAEIFAKAYPKIKERYLAQQPKIESKEISEDDVSDQELDKKIEEALKKIYK